IRRTSDHRMGRKTLVAEYEVARKAWKFRLVQTLLVHVCQLPHWPHPTALKNHSHPMPPPTSQKTMTTRPTNPTHLAFKVGAAAPARKRCSAVEVQNEKKAKAARAAEAEEVRKAKVQKLADLEDRMVVEENTMDITPRPQRPLPRRCVDLQRTEMNIGASLDGCEGIEDDSDLIDGDFTQVSGDDTDLEEDARPPAQKKAKVTNPRHDEVERAHKLIGSDGREKGGARPSDARPYVDARHIMIKRVSLIGTQPWPKGTDKLKLYKTRDSASFVFSFSLCPQIRC